MYQFITGPLLWLSFGIFFVGLGARVVLYIRGLDWRLDRVAYRAHIGQGAVGRLPVHHSLAGALLFGGLAQ